MEVDIGNPKPFKLFKLPILPQCLIIRLMCNVEQIKLAATSNKAEFSVRMTRLRIDFRIIYIQNQCTGIKLLPEETFMFCGDQQWQNPKPSISLKEVERDISKWGLTPCGVKNLSVISDRLNSMFTPSRPDSVVIRFPDFTELFNSEDQFFKEFLTNTLKSCEVLLLDGTDVSVEMMGVIFEIVSTSPIFKFMQLGIEMEVPIDFCHKNAFKFHNMLYIDARWVKLEDLLTLRNLGSVVFIRTTFTNAQVNTFINYWMNCEEKMFDLLRLGIAEAVNASVLFKDIAVLQIAAGSSDIYLFSSDPELTSTSLSMSYFGTEFHFIKVTVPDDDTPQEGYHQLHHRQFEILQKYERLRILEKSLAHPDVDNPDQVRATVDRIKRDLEMEGVTFENGIARVNAI